MIAQELAKKWVIISDAIEKNAFDGTWIWGKDKKLLMSYDNVQFASYGYNTWIDVWAHTISGLDIKFSSFYEAIRVANLMNNLKADAIWRGIKARTFEADNSGIQIADGTFLDTDLVSESKISKLYPTLKSLENRKKVVSAIQWLEDNLYKNMDKDTFQKALPKWIVLWANQDYKKVKLNQYSLDKLNTLMARINKIYPTQKFTDFVISQKNTFGVEKSDAKPPVNFFTIDLTSTVDQIFTKFKQVYALK